MTNPGGSGAVKTYLTGTPATATMDADVHLHARIAPADNVINPPLALSITAFDIEDYLVVSGIPTAVPECMVRMRTTSGIGSYIYSDVPPAPADVNMAATARWLPTVPQFAPDGSYWLPIVGGPLQLKSDSPPYLDSFYSFQVRGGDEVALPAVIFSGDAAMRLDAQGWRAPAFTFILVAVMHHNPEGPLSGIFESITQNAPLVDPNSDQNTINWGVRFRQGMLELWAGSTVLTHQSIDLQARPIVIAVSMDAATGKLLICDRTKSSRSFSTAGYSLYGIDMLIGQTSSGAPNETAYMDVLELDYYDRALSFEELADKLHLLDSIYGVVN